jgi:hypothetical protein
MSITLKAVNERIEKPNIFFTIWITFVIRYHHSKAVNSNKMFGKTLYHLFRHPYLLHDKESLATVLEVVELGISGSKSQPRASDPPIFKEDKSPLPASRRVRDAAEGLLNLVLEEVTLINIIITHADWLTEWGMLRVWTCSLSLPTSFSLAAEEGVWRFAREREGEKKERAQTSVSIDIYGERERKICRICPELFFFIFESNDRVPQQLIILLLSNWMISGSCENASSATFHLWPWEKDETCDDFGQTQNCFIYFEKKKRFEQNPRVKEATVLISHMM